MTDTILPHGMGRLYAPDARDTMHPMLAALSHPELLPKPRYRPYNLGPTLDQGMTSQCVGFSNRSKIASAPFMLKDGHGPTAEEIYHGAQQHDEWDGEDYEGSSVRGAFKYLQLMGYLKSYVWAQSVTEIERFVRDGYGTVVLGTNWYEGMAETDARGFAQATGGVLGGHAYHLFWMVPTTQEAWCKNSWGAQWGVTLHARPGCFKLRYADLERLLVEDGEAGAGIEVKM